jgi:hypothetical protein
MSNLREKGSGRKVYPHPISSGSPPKGDEWKQRPGVFAQIVCVTTAGRGRVINKKRVQGLY